MKCAFSFFFYFWSSDMFGTTLDTAKVEFHDGATKNDSNETLELQGHLAASMASVFWEMHKEDAVIDTNEMYFVSARTGAALPEHFLTVPPKDTLTRAYVEKCLDLRERFAVDVCRDRIPVRLLTFFTSRFSDCVPVVFGTRAEGVSRYHSAILTRQDAESIGVCQFPDGQFLFDFTPA